MEERNNINLFRKKRARKKLITRLVILALILLVVVLIVVNWKKIIAPLKDIALDVGQGGFPVELPGSTGYVLDELGENFYLLTDTYLYTYTSEGAMVANIQHGFQNAVSAANEKRVLVYDKNGKEFKFFSRTGEEYTGSVEDTIVFGSIGNDERSAIVTTSTRYSNYLYVFNGEGKQIFRWASPDLKLMQAEFSEDDKSIYVSALGSSGGSLQLYVLRFDLDNAESHIWQTFIGTDISYSMECSEDGLFVVTGSDGVLLDKETGSILATTAINRSITSIPATNGLRALVFADTGSSGDIITVYGEGLVAGESILVDNLTAFCTDDGKCYVLSGPQLIAYDDTLTQINSYELDDVFSDMIIIGGHAYLLGYNEVQRIAL
ncbi:MAG: hypothetical protein E7478_09165 [Ruminococcaceae bacterium]|nr:hypothetical protein [Oscillospiraceae bacterium]